MFEIIKYTKNTSRSASAKAGTFDVKIPKWGGFCIRECTHFVKGEAHWFSFPTRKYEEDGIPKYYPLNAFDTPEMMKHFSEKMVQAIKEWLLLHPEDRPQ